MGKKRKQEYVNDYDEDTDLEEDYDEDTDIDEDDYEEDADIDEDDYEDDTDIDEDDYEDDTEIEEIFDLSDAKVPKSKNNSKSSSKAGAFSIVNAPTGHRATISSSSFNSLGYPKKVQVLFKENELVIGCKLNKESEKYTVRNDGKKTAKGHIYNKHLVREITEEYDLDFSERTSITFGDAEYYEQGGAKFVVINMAD